MRDSAPRSALVLLVALGLAFFVVRLASDREGADVAANGAAPNAGSGRCLEESPELDVHVGSAWRTSWRRLDASDCRPGTWLYQFREDGQNFAGYRIESGGQLRRSSSLALRELSPYSDARGRELAEPMAEFLSLFFQRDVVELSALAIPAPPAEPLGSAAIIRHDAEELLEGLLGSCPTGLAGCLALTDRDLFARDLEYVFGLGDFRERVGVMSTHRLWGRPGDSPVPGGGQPPAREVEALRRALKIAAHEMSHQLGVAHCVHYKGCLMAGTSSLADIDSGQLRLCPLDHDKLAWRLGFDARRRFSELAEFGIRHGLYSEAAYWRRMAEHSPSLPNAAGGG